MSSREVPTRLSVGGVARVLGCHPKTINRKLAVRAASDNPFPEPTGWIGNRRTWLLRDVEAWATRENARPASSRRFNLPSITAVAT